MSQITMGLIVIFYKQILFAQDIYLFGRIINIPGMHRLIQVRVSNQKKNCGAYQYFYRGT